MIDTFNLTLTDLDIAGGNLTVETPNYNHATGELEPTYELFRDSNTGQMVTGKKAYLNHGKFTFEIKPNHFVNPSLISERPDLTTVKKINLSVPRYAKGKNRDPVSVGEFKEVLSDLEKTLRDNGIRTNIETASASRVDIFKMVNTDYEFSNYVEVLGLLDFKRLDKTRDYGTTLMMYNKQRQFQIYDKIEEEIIKSKKEKNSNYNRYQKHDLVRFEYRLLKAKSVKSQIGFSTVKDFHQNYGEIERAFYDFSTATFGKEPENVTKLIIEDFRQGLIEYKNRGLKNPIEQFIQHHISFPQIEQQIGTDQFIRIIKEEFNRKTAGEWKKKIREAIKENRLSSMDFTTKESYISLYAEIKRKLLIRTA